MATMHAITTTHAITEPAVLVVSSDTWQTCVMPCLALPAVQSLIKTSKLVKCHLFAGLDVDVEDLTFPHRVCRCGTFTAPFVKAPNDDQYMIQCKECLAKHLAKQAVRLQALEAQAEKLIPSEEERPGVLEPWGYSPGQIAELLRGGLEVFGIDPDHSDIYCYLKEQAEDNEEPDYQIESFDFTAMDVMMARVEKIQDDALRLYLCADLSAEITAALVLQRMEHCLLRGGIEPDCCGGWQTMFEFVLKEDEYMELSESERVTAVHPREKFRKTPDPTFLSMMLGEAGASKLVESMQDTGYASP